MAIDAFVTPAADPYRAAVLLAVTLRWVCRSVLLGGSPTSHARRADNMVTSIRTPRVLLRQWSAEDAEAALSIYGTEAVSRWSKPWARRIADADEMRSLIERWLVEDAGARAPEGHWALVLRRGGELVGGLSLAYIPKQGENLTIRWELAPAQWGNGYAAEAADMLVHWVMHEAGIIEVFALVHPDNARGARTAERIGMEWVRDLGDHLRVYRTRDGELGSPEPLDWQARPS